MNNNGLKKIHKVFNSNIFWAVVSLLIAIFLWSYVTTTEGTLAERTISGVKVEFVGIEKLRDSRGLIVTEQDTSTVSVTISGTRRVVSQLSNANVTATINLNNVSTDGRYTVNYDLSYPDNISSSEIAVIKTSTDVVTFYVDKEISKTIEVHGIFTGSTAEGYMTPDSVTIEPLVVKVMGPKVDVSKIDHAEVVVARTNIDSSLQYLSTYDLVDSEGNKLDFDSVKCDVEEVEVTLSVLSTKEVPLDVTIIDGAGATKEINATVTIEPASVILAGDSGVIDSVSKINLATIDLADFATEYTATYNIVPPNDTENLTGITEAVVTVKLSGVSVRSFTVPSANITCINVPENFDASIVTKSITVQLRGTAEDLDEVQINNIRVVADLSDQSILNGGIYNPDAAIYVDGFPSVGAIQKYQVYVDITQK